MMIKRTRAVAIILAIFVLFMLPVTSIYAEGNLLKNSGFEEGDDSAPSGWTKDAWIPDESAGYLSVQSADVHSGSKAAVIENLEPNHLKWIQTVQVEPDHYYRISGWIKVVNTVSGGFGANIFAVGVGGGYPSVMDTAGEWQQLEFIGKTGPDQKELGVGAGLGGYSSLSQGKAYFDDLSVEALDEAPTGATIVPLDNVAPQGDSDKPADVPHKISPAKLLLISALFSAVFAVLYNRAFRSEKLMKQPETLYVRWLYIVFGVAFILRIWIGLTAQGYQNDMNTFIAWGHRMADLGPGKFYEDGYFADYPPGYLYILYLLSALRGIFGFANGSGAESLLFKLPAILSDLVLGLLIYRAGRQKLGSGLAFGLALLFLFNPAVLINSAAWGQADSFFLIFLLLSIQGAANKRLVASAVWFAIATLVKPQALIFTPVLLFAFYHQRAWKQLALGAVYGLGAFGLLAAPFFWNNGGISRLINLYKATLSSYPYSSVNAFNLYALTDPMWSSLDLTWLGITYRVWGFIFILVAVALALFYSFKKDRHDLSKSFFIGMVLIVTMFVLGTKMHERYMYPALILAIFAYIQSKDRRFLTLFLGFSLTQYVNVGYTLAHLNAGNNPGADGIVLVTAITNLALFLYMLYTGYDVYVRNRIKSLPPVSSAEQKQRDDLNTVEGIRPVKERSGGSGLRLKLSRRDWIWMLVITALYAAVALFHLGSNKSPETLWEPSASGESFYVDLGQSRQLERVNVFGGVGTGKFKLEFSESPDAWNNPLEVNEDVGNVFIWKSQPLTVAARYVKLTVLSPGFTLNEMAFYEQNGGRVPLPVAGVTPDGGTPKRGAPANLFDEQSLIPEYANFMNSTYFDEIYHARTAYEHYHGIVPYENTHPPLGKLLIGIGMELFGVNPFGWRIIGTLFGIAMLPLIYVMALRLFKQTRYAALAAGLFALDFMHFTQTRISTIDVYGVFFIMLMFYFMQRYFTMNFYRVPLSKTLIPLFWSGLFFGIGVASKWIVLYGGAGLAIMLALVLFDRYREYRAAKRMLAEGRISDQELAGACRGAANSFWKNTIITLVSCVGFFVIIPGIVYSLSFIPSLSATANGYTLKGLIDAQTSMYNYHSQLVATHPFASSWWEWPFMKRPVWFFSGGEGLPQGQVSSIVTMGNPLIWWTGIFAMLGTLWLTIKRKDKSLFMIWIAFFSQYVPWMLVPRETFLYHYFAMVPFMILAIVYIMKLIDSKYPGAKYVRYVYVGLAALLFIAFYPVLSGMQVNGSYVTQVLRWFPSWVF